MYPLIHQDLSAGEGCRLTVGPNATAVATASGLKCVIRQRQGKNYRTLSSAPWDTPGGALNEIWSGQDHQLRRSTAYTIAAVEQKWHTDSSHTSSACGVSAAGKDFSRSPAPQVLDDPRVLEAAANAAAGVLRCWDPISVPELPSDLYEVAAEAARRSLAGTAQDLDTTSGRPVVPGGGLTAAIMGWMKHASSAHLAAARTPPPIKTAAGAAASHGVTSGATSLQTATPRSGKHSQGLRPAGVTQSSRAAGAGAASLADNGAVRLWDFSPRLQQGGMDAARNAMMQQAAAAAAAGYGSLSPCAETAVHAADFSTAGHNQGVNPPPGNSAVPSSAEGLNAPLTTSLSGLAAAAAAAGLGAANTDNGTPRSRASRWGPPAACEDSFNHGLKLQSSSSAGALSPTPAVALDSSFSYSPSGTKRYKMTAPQEQCMDVDFPCNPFKTLTSGTKAEKHHQGSKSKSSPAAASGSAASSAAELSALAAQGHTLDGRTLGGSFTPVRGLSNLSLRSPYQGPENPALYADMDSSTSCGITDNSHEAGAVPTGAGALAAAATGHAPPLHTGSMPSTSGFGTSASGVSILSSSFADSTLAEEQQAKLGPLSRRIVQRFAARTGKGSWQATAPKAQDDSHSSSDDSDIEEDCAWGTGHTSLRMPRQQHNDTAAGSLDLAHLLESGGRNDRSAFNKAFGDRRMAEQQLVVGMACAEGSRDPGVPSEPLPAPAQPEKHQQQQQEAQNLQRQLPRAPGSGDEGTGAPEVAAPAAPPAGKRIKLKLGGSDRAAAGATVPGGGRGGGRGSDTPIEPLPAVVQPPQQQEESPPLQRLFQGAPGSSGEVTKPHTGAAQHLQPHPQAGSG